MKISESTEEWALALYGEVAQSTAKTYLRNMKYIENELSDMELEDVLPKNLRILRKKLLDSGLEKSSVNLRLKVARLFFKFCYNEGFISCNPMANLKPIKDTSNKSPKAIESTDIRKMIEGASNIRDEMIIRVLADTGVRVSALCGIRVKDFDYKNKTAEVLSKGKMTTIYFSDITARLLDMYIRSQEKDDKDLIFGIQRQGVYWMLKRLGQKVGVEACNAHAFRHGLAKRMLQGGASMSLIAQVLGHTSIQTTYEYYARWDTDQVQKEKGKYTDTF